MLSEERDMALGQVGSEHGACELLVLCVESFIGAVVV